MAAVEDDLGAAEDMMLSWTSSRSGATENFYGHVTFVDDNDAPEEIALVWSGIEGFSSTVLPDHPDSTGKVEEWIDMDLCHDCSDIYQHELRVEATDTGGASTSVTVAFDAHCQY